MPRGRRPRQISEEERAKLRREKVRLNVQAFRRRKAGAKDGDSDGKPVLRWIEDTRWQTAYDQKSEKRSSSGNVAKERSTSMSTSSSSLGLDSSAQDATEETILVRAEPPIRLMTPDILKQEYFAMLSSFPSRFLPRRISLPSSPNMIEEIRTPCAFWVTTAHTFAQRNDRNPLSDVLMALTTAFASAELAREDLGTVSHRFYQRSLLGVRKQLQPIINGKSNLTGDDDAAMLFLACYAASVFELYVNKSFEDMNRHVRGIGILINHQTGIRNVSSSVGTNLLEEYRMLDATLAFMERRKPTFNMPIRVLPPLAQLISSRPLEFGPGCSIFTTLLDISEYIPVAMVELDALKPLPQHKERTKQILRSIRTLLIVQTRLEQWSRYLYSKCTSGSSPGSQDSLDEGVNEVDIEGICSYDYACSWMFCLSYEVYALEEVVAASKMLPKHPTKKAFGGLDLRSIPYTSDVLRTKLLHSAGKLAQLMAYFFQPSQGIIGRSLAVWPLEACWNALENEWTRLQAEIIHTHRDIRNGLSLAENDRKRVLVQRYLQQCETTAKIAQSYGMPVMRDRSQRPPEDITDLVQG